ncbi:MAG: hypothetical protein GYB33_08175 [Gammaproteobacteria bacterium]|nr:hypothetical protein [Gammaproteobacteria bacterium]
MEASIEEELQPKLYAFQARVALFAVGASYAGEGGIPHPRYRRGRV